MIIFLFIIFLVTTSIARDDIDKAIDLYMNGELSLIVEDISSAEKYFTEALKYSPDNTGILLSLLDIYIDTGNFSKIEKILDKYLKLEKLNINYSLKIVDLYKSFNRENTLNILEDFIINNPDDIELKYAKAEILILNQNWEELLLVYADMYIINQDEEVFDTLLNMGLMIEDPLILYESLEYIWLHNKNNIKVLELLIQLSYLSKEETNKTKEYLNELIEYDSYNVFALMMLAEINIIEENFLETIELLNKINITDETPLEVYKMFLISYSNLGDYENEIIISSKIIEEFPFEPIGYESLSISYLESARYMDAIEILNKAIKIFPDEYYFYYYLGLSYRNSHKNKEAINYFLKTLKINPDLKNVMHELAKLYNLELDYTKSDSLFSVLLEQNVNDAMIMNDYAYLIADRENVSMKKLNFALELSEDAVSIVPDSPEYLDTIGWIYYKIGKYNKALDYLLRSESLDKHNSIILEHIGDVYLKLEKYEKALNTYNRIMIQNPGNDNVMKKIELLNER